MMFPHPTPSDTSGIVCGGGGGDLMKSTGTSVPKLFPPHSHSHSPSTSSILFSQEREEDHQDHSHSPSNELDGSPVGMMKQLSISITSSTPPPEMQEGSPAQLTRPISIEKTTTNGTLNSNLIIPPSPTHGPSPAHLPQPSSSPPSQSHYRSSSIPLRLALHHDAMGRQLLSSPAGGPTPAFSGHGVSSQQQQQVHHSSTSGTPLDSAPSSTRLISGSSTQSPTRRPSVQSTNSNSVSHASSSSIGSSHLSPTHHTHSLLNSVNSTYSFHQAMTGSFSSSNNFHPFLNSGSPSSTPTPSFPRSRNLSIDNTNGMHSVNDHLLSPLSPSVSGRCNSAKLAPMSPSVHGHTVPSTPAGSSQPHQLPSAHSYANGAYSSSTSSVNSVSATPRPVQLGHSLTQTSPPLSLMATPRIPSLNGLPGGHLVIPTNVSDSPIRRKSLSVSLPFTEKSTSSEERQQHHRATSSTDVSPPPPAQVSIGPISLEAQPQPTSTTASTTSSSAAASHRSMSAVERLLSPALTMPRTPTTPSPRPLLEPLERKVSHPLPTLSNMVDTSSTLDLTALKSNSTTTRSRSTSPILRQSPPNHMKQLHTNLAPPSLAGHPSTSSTSPSSSLSPSFVELATRELKRLSLAADGTIALPPSHAILLASPQLGSLSPPLRRKSGQLQLEPVMTPKSKVDGLQPLNSTTATTTEPTRDELKRLSSSSTTNSTAASNLSSASSPQTASVEATPTITRSHTIHILAATALDVDELSFEPQSRDSNELEDSEEPEPSVSSSRGTSRSVLRTASLSETELHSPPVKRTSSTQGSSLKRHSSQESANSNLSQPPSRAHSRHQSLSGSRGALLEKELTTSAGTNPSPAPTRKTKSRAEELSPLNALDPSTTKRKVRLANSTGEKDDSNSPSTVSHPRLQHILARQSSFTPGSNLNPSTTTSPSDASKSKPSGGTRRAQSITLSGVLVSAHAHTQAHRKKLAEIAALRSPSRTSSFNSAQATAAAEALDMAANKQLPLPTTTASASTNLTPNKAAAQRLKSLRILGITERDLMLEKALPTRSSSLSAGSVLAPLSTTASPFIPPLIQPTRKSLSIAPTTLQRSTTQPLTSDLAINNTPAITTPSLLKPKRQLSTTSLSTASTSTSATNGVPTGATPSALNSNSASATSVNNAANTLSTAANAATAARVRSFPVLQAITTTTATGSATASNANLPPASTSPPPPLQKQSSSLNILKSTRR